MKKEHELLEAARTGNIELVEKLLSPVKSISWSLASLGLKARVNVNCHDASGYTPLHHAALNGHKNVVKVLLENSASTNVGDVKGSFPLHLAAWSGNHEIVELLLNHGPSIAKVNEKNGDDETALHCAAQHGHAKAAEVLLKSGADSSIRNMRGESPLDLASQYGRLGVVRLLLYHQPSLLKRFPESFSPLHVASRNGHKQIVELLIAHGADVNRSGENGTALHEAALFGKTDVVKLLLTRGANPYALDPKNRTPLELVKQLHTQTSREISRLILGRMQDGDDYIPLSPNPAPFNTREHRASRKQDFLDGRHLPEQDTSIEKPEISVEEHYIAPEGDSQPTVNRSHTFKGFVRSWNRSSARKAVIRRSASVRNSKSLPRLPSSRFPSTTASPELSRQFHPSSTMFPVSPTRPSPLHLSVLSLPAAMSSHQSSRGFDCEKITGALEHPEDDSVFLTNPLPPDASSSPITAPYPSLPSSVTHRPCTPPSNIDPLSSVDPPTPSSSSLNGSQLKQSPIGYGEPYSPGQKPKKPVRQKLSTVTSPPPVPPKPAHLCQKRPPSPSLPPPVDEEFSDEDEINEIGEGELVTDDAIHVCSKPSCCDAAASFVVAQ